MQDELQKILSESRFIPVIGFDFLLSQKIERKIRLITCVRFSFYSVMSVLSVLVFYNSLSIIYSEITSSWIFSVIALIFSESIDSIFVIYKDIFYMFIESLPVMSLVMLCLFTFVFTLSLRGALIYKRKLFNL